VPQNALEARPVVAAQGPNQQRPFDSRIIRWHHAVPSTIRIKRFLLAFLLEVVINLQPKNQSHG
jgi:hypothetical protein